MIDKKNVMHSKGEARSSSRRIDRRSRRREDRRSRNEQPVASFRNRTGVALARRKIELTQTADSTCVKKTARQIEHETRNRASRNVPVVERVAATTIESMMNGNMGRRKVVRNAAVEHSVQIFKDVAERAFDVRTINVEVSLFVGDGVRCSH